MAEPRRLTDLLHGHVGRLTYVPRGAKNDGRPGTLQSSRITTGASHLQVLGSSAELYPASKSQLPQGSSRQWQQRRTQKRWLHKSHPEAFMGNVALDYLLEENIKRYHKVEGQETDRPLLATGQMTMRDPKRVVGLRVIASATGQSGEFLRLVRIGESKWQWGSDQNVHLNLEVIDPEDVDEEVIWASDGLPISQIKFATSLSRYEPIRWLLVQKGTSTTILEPEYHKVPMANKSSNLDTEQRPSHIQANPILTISHKDTGGNAHVDVAFNPSSQGSRPQIAIMDECGYWSVWDIQGTRKNAISASFSIHRCGHIQEGLLDELPQFPVFPAEKHGLLFVGAVEKDEFLEMKDEEMEEDGISVARSQHLLAWNSNKVEVFDLVANVTLKLPTLATTKGKRNREWFLDIQLSPVNQNHIFVLTTRQLYWVDLFAPGDEGENHRPVLLLACPHFIPAENLSMTTCRVSEGENTAAVFIYSSRHTQIRAFWFRLAAETNIPQWHRQVMSLPYDGDVKPTTFRSLVFHNAKLAGIDGPPYGPGSHYKRNKVQFYQGSILGEDLSLRYCICATSPDRNLQIQFPSRHLGQNSRKKMRRQKRRRRLMLRYVGDSFVLPDGVTEADFMIRTNGERGVIKAHNLKEQKRSHKPVLMNFDGLVQTLFESMAMTAHAEVGLPLHLLLAIRTTIDQGMEQGRLPLTTWQEIANRMGPTAEQSASVSDLEDDLLRLFDKIIDESVIAQLRRLNAGEQSSSMISLTYLVYHFSERWIEPLGDKLSEAAQQLRRKWITEIARDVFLSSYAIMVQDTALFGSVTSENNPDKRLDMISSQAIQSSQSTNAGIPSSQEIGTSAATKQSDAAIQRLQLLTPSVSIGKMASAKQSSVLSYWPTERGVETSVYISSVAVATDKKFDEARQRLQKIENRRKSQLDKYKMLGIRASGIRDSDVRQSGIQVSERPGALSPFKKRGGIRDSDIRQSGIRVSERPGALSPFKRPAAFRRSERPGEMSPFKRRGTIRPSGIRESGFGVGASDGNRINEVPTSAQMETQEDIPEYALSSQQHIPESSQPQGGLLAMSQPVSGMFGDRKKAKKGKRKSGFR